MPIKKGKVFSSRIIQAIKNRIIAIKAGKAVTPYRWGGSTASVRILFVANAFIPTLQLSFIKPLNQQFQAGKIYGELLTDEQMKELFGRRHKPLQAISWISKRIADSRPSVIIFCRYSGGYSEAILKIAHENGIRTIYHVDDDLLNVPLEIGAGKYQYHNHPKRLESVRYLLARSDLVYCSTEALRKKLLIHGDKTRFFAGKIYCSSSIISPARLGAAKIIGYMGFDHDHDFKIVIPSLVQLLRKHQDLEFELFGSIAKPKELDEFGQRIRIILPVREYDSFLEALASRSWDVGICPLAKTTFNELKANTKWVEYTAVGAAVVASAGAVYDECCGNGCGIVAKSSADWTEALEYLINDNGARYNIVKMAQGRLRDNYSIEKLSAQVLEVLRRVQEIPPNWQG